MPQANIFFEKEEDEVVKKYSKIWNLSKMEAIKKIIKKFGEKDGDS